MATATRRTATTETAPPGYASRVGTIDPDSKNRVYVDETLREVGKGDPRAAFVYKRADLDRIRERRAELELDGRDEAARAAIDSHEVERQKAARAMVPVADRLARLEEVVKEDKASGAQGTAVGQSDEIAALRAEIKALRAEIKGGKKAGKADAEPTEPADDGTTPPEAPADST
jgi:hypothetical protein